MDLEDELRKELEEKESQDQIVRGVEKGVSRESHKIKSLELRKELEGSQDQIVRGVEKGVRRERITRSNRQRSLKRI